MSTRAPAQEAKQSAAPAETPAIPREVLDRLHSKSAPLTVLSEVLTRLGQKNPLQIEPSGWRMSGATLASIVDSPRVDRGTRTSFDPNATYQVRLELNQRDGAAFTFTSVTGGSERFSIPAPQKSSEALKLLNALLDPDNIKVPANGRYTAEEVGKFVLHDLDQRLNGLIGKLVDIRDGLQNKSGDFVPGDTEKAIDQIKRAFAEATDAETTAPVAARMFGRPGFPGTSRRAA